MKKSKLAALFFGVILGSTVIAMPPPPGGWGGSGGGGGGGGGAGSGSEGTPCLAERQMLERCEARTQPSERSEMCRDFYYAWLDCFNATR